MNKCDHTLLKGKNKGLRCNRNAIWRNKCKNHVSYDKEKDIKICTIWKINSLINPITNKSIIRNGPTYLKLKKLCLLNDISKVCDEWNKDKLINPYNNKKITNLVRKKLEELCINNQNTISIDNNSITTIKCWIIGKKIGSGGYGQVFECMRDNSSQIYAIKISKDNSIGLITEINVLKDLNKFKFKWVPKLYDTGVYEDLRYIVIERLYNLQLDINNIIEIIESITMLHRINRSHNDIKFDNIMQRENGEIVIIDYGVSSFFGRTNYVVGTPLYMSINAHNGIITRKNDLESLFYCLSQIIIKKLPWTKLYKNRESLNLLLINKKLFLENLHNYYPKKSIIYEYGIYIKNYNDKYPPNYSYLINLYNR